MKTVSISDAKTHLSRLIDGAARGEPFIITKAGKPMVKVVPVDAPERKPVKRIGFLEGQFTIPDDIKAIDGEEIEKLFYGEE